MPFFESQKKFQFDIKKIGLKVLVTLGPGIKELRWIST